MFPQNLLLVDNDDMNPYVSKGDVVIFEPMRLDRRLHSSVYVVELNAKKMVARIQLLIRGGIRLIFDGNKEGLIYLKQSEKGQVILIGHVTGRVLKDGEMIEGYSLYNNPFER